jgi:predicted nucleic acid-binding protein
VTYLLDTNVYLRALRSDDHRDEFRRSFFPLLPATVHSAVVVYELSVDAETRTTRDALAEFVEPMTRAGRVVTPAFSSWESAANLVSRLHAREPGYRSRLPALLNDVLIALGARQVGATLISHNRADFELIRRHLTFELSVQPERPAPS